MTLADCRLIRHLAAAMAVKLMMLAGLWWYLVHDSRVEVDTARTAAHITGTQAGPGAKP